VYRTFGSEISAQNAEKSLAWQSDVLILCALVIYNVLCIIYIQDNRSIFWTSMPTETSKFLHFWNCTSNCSNSSRALEPSRALSNVAPQKTNWTTMPNIWSNTVYNCGSGQPYLYLSVDSDEETLEYEPLSVWIYCWLPRTSHRPLRSPCKSKSSYTWTLIQVERTLGYESLQSSLGRWMGTCHNARIPAGSLFVWRHAKAL